MALASSVSCLVRVDLGGGTLNEFKTLRAREPRKDSSQASGPGNTRDLKWVEE